MWDCGECGAMAIAASVPACPQCGAAKEDDMPKATTEGGPSNAASEDTPAAEVPAPPPVSAPKAEHIEHAVQALGVPPEEAESMTKAELVERAQAAAGDGGADAAPAPAPKPAPKSAT